MAPADAVSGQGSSRDFDRTEAPAGPTRPSPSRAPEENREDLALARMLLEREDCRALV